MAVEQKTAARKTDQTRAYADQVEKLQWLYKLKNISSADFIGSRIENDLDAEYETIRPIVEKIKKTLAKAAGPDLAGEGA